MGISTLVSLQNYLSHRLASFFTFIIFLTLFHNTLSHSIISLSNQLYLKSIIKATRFQTQSCIEPAGGII